MEQDPNRIILHHSGDISAGPQAEKINRYHKSRRFPKSRLGFFGGYHLLIEKNGVVFRYRDDNEVGAHDADENYGTLGVCLAGNFDLTVPTMRQQATLRRVLWVWQALWGISTDRIDPHRYGDQTSCPGRNVYNLWAREILNDPAITPDDIALKQVADYKLYLDHASR